MTAVGNGHDPHTREARQLQQTARLPSVSCSLQWEPIIAVITWLANSSCSQQGVFSPPPHGCADACDRLLYPNASPTSKYHFEPMRLEN